MLLGVLGAVVVGVVLLGVGESVGDGGGVGVGEMLNWEEGMEEWMTGLNDDAMARDVDQTGLAAEPGEGWDGSVRLRVCRCGCLWRCSGT
jgi:hypothetical protein